MTWREIGFQELGFLSRGRSRHRPRDAEFLYGGPYPFVQTGDVKHAGLYLREYSQTYSEAGLDQSKLWPKGTLCITIAANIAETSLLGFDACFPDSIIGFIADEEKCDARFIKYYLEIVKKRYQQVSQGVAQDNLSQEKLLSFRLKVPFVEEQRRIADILSNYDLLIDNNTRRITLLEQTSKTLYEEWFVYLRFPGHEHTKIVKGVPDGWEKLVLKEVLELQRGFDLPIQQRVDGVIPIYASTGINGFHNQSKVKEPGVVTGRSGTLGIVNYVDVDYWPLNTTLWVKEFKKVSPIFALHLLRQMNLEQFNGGVSVPSLDRNVVHRQLVLLPNKKTMNRFEEIAVGLLKQIIVLKKMNLKLEQARDLLLPRLMSGEVAV